MLGLGPGTYEIQLEAMVRRSALAVERSDRLLQHTREILKEAKEHCKQAKEQGRSKTTADGK
jgi:hypothetical protein